MQRRHSSVGNTTEKLSSCLTLVVVKGEEVEGTENGFQSTHPTEHRYQKERERRSDKVIARYALASPSLSLSLSARRAHSPRKSRGWLNALSFKSLSLSLSFPSRRQETIVKKKNAPPPTIKGSTMTKLDFQLYIFFSFLFLSSSAKQQKQITRHGRQDLP